MQERFWARFLAHPVALSLWASSAAFGTYFCMYGFRKPFTAASFEEGILGGWDQKAVLISAQVIGYLISKFIGIRVIAEMPAASRGRTILLLIAAAHLALALFAVVPSPWHVLCIFLNGLPLGLVFGLVLGFLEGRKMTEALAAGLCASFILAGGVCKSIGSWLMQVGVSERWMPFAAGCIFYLPLALGVWMLVCIPPPNISDLHHRNVRTPMDSAARRRFLQKYALGIGSLAAIYFLFTILRSLRDDFGPELWKGLGVQAIPSTYAWTDFYVACLVLILNALGIAIRDNRKALLTSLAVSFGGALLIVTTILGRMLELVSPGVFMVAMGLGLYLPYVAIHTTVFERMLAMTRDQGNIGFLMYVVDSLGYLGYVVVMLIRQKWTGGPEILPFFSWFSVVAAMASMVLLGVAAIYFAKLSTAPVDPGVVV